jgi:ribonucleoside-triphosphate reductase (thioredoxin)
MFDKIYRMKFLPPGRGLWAMGSSITEEKMSYAALNNCAFVSTQDLKQEGSKPFTFLMDAAMLGVGVGFDTLGAGEGFIWIDVHDCALRHVGGWCVSGHLTVKAPHAPKPGVVHVIPDCREGWVDSVGMILDAYFHGKVLPKFDYSAIRAAGSPIKVCGSLCAWRGTVMILGAMAGLWWHCHRIRTTETVACKSKQAPVPSGWQAHHGHRNR